MKRLAWLPVAFVSVMASPVLAAEMGGNVNGFIGQKKLDTTYWEPLDKQVELGVISDFGGKNWPVNIAVDLLVSVDDTTIAGVDVTGSTVELDFGVRKAFNISGTELHPYVSGGLALITAHMEGSSGFTTVSDNDSSMGYWVSGGAYWTFAKHFNAGIDLRYSNADVELFNITGEAGGRHIGIMAGYHW